MSAEMQPTCEDVEGLLAEAASGPLEPSEAATLERHLGTCASCRARVQSYRALFAAVALARPGPAETAAMGGLAERTLSAWRGQGQRRLALQRVAAAAGLLLALGVPWGLWRASRGAAGDAASPALETAFVTPAEWLMPAALEMEEPDALEASADDAPLLDELAFEGDGAFSLGDSG
jgi:anti-sigma factor RsiW